MSGRVDRAEIVRSKDFRVIYSNAFRMRVGENDIGMVIGYATNLPTEERPVVQDEAEIVVTPRQLKYMSRMIERAVQDIEAVFGEIALPEYMADTRQFDG